MDGLDEIMKDAGVDAKVIGVPPQPMIRFEDSETATQRRLINIFFAETTKRGVLLHPNHCWFLSMAHTDADADKTLDVSRESIRIAKDKCVMPL